MCGSVALTKDLIPSFEYSMPTATQVDISVSTTDSTTNLKFEMTFELTRTEWSLVQWVVVCSQASFPMSPAVQAKGTLVSKDFNSVLNAKLGDAYGCSYTQGAGIHKDSLEIIVEDSNGGSYLPPITVVIGDFSLFVASSESGKASSNGPPIGTRCPEKSYVCEGTYEGQLEYCDRTYDPDAEYLRVIKRERKTAIIVMTTVIVLLIGFVLYCAVGVVNNVRAGESGCEVIPNSDFWCGMLLACLTTESRESSGEHSSTASYALLNQQTTTSDDGFVSTPLQEASSDPRHPMQNVRRNSAARSNTRAASSQNNVSIV